MKYLFNAIWLIGLAVVISCSQSTVKETGVTAELSDDQLLDTIQYYYFQYFWEGAEPTSGMARERIHMDGIYPQNDRNVITSGGSGFGLMAILVGIERKFISREEGFERFRKIVSYLDQTERFHGAWPHWLEGETGKAKPFSQKDDGGDLVETAYLIQGLVTVAEYFRDGSDKERQLVGDIQELINGVEWNWYTREKNVLYWHWSPNFGWEMNFPVEGYNECLITYILAASSESHPVSANVYHEGWARGGKIRGSHTAYGLVLDLNHNFDEDYGGPLFWSHYSYLGLDPRNLKDAYSSYWNHNVNHVLIDYRHCVENPGKFSGYGENCWGLSASYSISHKVAEADPAKRKKLAATEDIGYAAHSPARDIGVISPTAALSSFPYSPVESMKAARFFYDSLGNRLMGKYGFYDAFSLEYDWFPERYLAIDQGPVIVMIENYRSGLLWNLFMKNKDIQKGLDKLGFQYK